MNPFFIKQTTDSPQSLSVSVYEELKMSCNGCRILRKGCERNCIIRPCLEWIQNPESQANATLFLAKFYGRAGLLNLLNAGAPHLRPGIFRSLLYDACGRISNPIYGSVGLMWSGNWHLCQAAVDSVLNGSPIMQLPFDNDDDDDASRPIMPLKGGDIRHLSTQLDGVPRVRTRCRQSSSGAKTKSEFGGELDADRTHDSLSVETVEASLVNQVGRSNIEREDREIALELTLGVNPTVQHHLSTVEEMRN